MTAPSLLARSAGYVKDAASKLDAAVQLCGREPFSTEITKLEEACDDLAKRMLDFDPKKPARIRSLRRGR